MTSHTYYIGELFVLDHKTYQITAITKKTIEATYASEHKPDKTFKVESFPIQLINKKARAL